MTLLSIIQNAADEIGIPRPSVVVASTDTSVRQLLRLANREGKELGRRAPWQAMRKEKTFVSIAAAAQTSSIPSDFDRFVDESFFNRTMKRPVNGPLTPIEWQAQQALSAAVLTDAFMVRLNTIYLTPTPTAGWTYAYEYISNQWCESSDGTDQSAWATDTDTGLLDEELMTQGIIWRFLKVKGLDYSEAFRSYEIEVTQAMQRDGGKRTVRFSGAPDINRARIPTVQEGSWDLP